MPTRKLKLLPGVQAEQSPLFNQTNWAACDGINFYAGVPQKMPGWSAYSSTPVIGTCRKLHGWADLEGNPYVAAGTEQRLLVYIGGEQFDITPLRATANPAPALTTTNGSASVQVTDAGNGSTAGDWVYIPTQTSEGGVVLFGFYQIATIIDANNYTVTASSPATSGAGPGGAVPTYTTSNGFASVNVLLPNHGLSTGQEFNAALPTTGGGVTISGIYDVTVVDANNFTITASAAATGNATFSENSGNMQIQYLLPTGSANGALLDGYGAGDYGAGNYGRANASSGGIIEPLRYWSLDHFGQDLIASPRDLGIYFWPPPAIAPAAVLSMTAPLYNRVVFVMPQVQIVVALGSETGGVQHPTLLRWSDSGDFTDWTTTATNQAGSYQLPTASTCVAGLASGLTALIWTDVDMYTMTYVGLPFVFNVNRLAVECEAMSFAATVVLGGSVIWPSLGQFFRFDGSSVYPIECPVHDFFYGNLDPDMTDAVIGSTNSYTNEAVWCFPVSGTNGGQYYYVKFNYVENAWDYGTVFQMTAMCDHQFTDNGPLSVDLGGLIQQIGTSPDANGAALHWFVRSGYFDLSEGEDYVYVNQIIPDFVVSSETAQINFHVLQQNYSGDTPTILGPFVIGPTTEWIDVEARGRQLAIQIGGTDVGSSVRLGAIRYRYAPDGRN